jgi:hypothetical protein
MAYTQNLEILIPKRVPPFQIPTQNGEMKVLFNYFYRRINQVAILFGNLGSRNETTYSEFRNLEIFNPHKICNLQVFYVYILHVVNIHALDLHIRFFENCFCLNNYPVFLRCKFLQPWFQMDRSTIST